MPHVQIAQTVHRVFNQQFYQVLVIVHAKIIIIGMGFNVHYVMIPCVYHVLIKPIASNVFQELFYQALAIVHAQIIIIGMGLNAHYVMILCV